MVSVRAAKSKGSQFEMNCAYSLKAIYPDIRRPGPEGFQLQYDLESEYQVFECKRLKGMSWNQAEKFFTKLESVAPENKTAYLLFKSNRQPCLVMAREIILKVIRVFKFEDYFGIPFTKHPSTRVKKKVLENGEKIREGV